jgi:methylmalonyl-CoA/ethylmalonyl-CoA epimerase
MEFDPKQTFRNPIQIGLIVDDLDNVLAVLEETFGIGPFRIVDFPPEGNEDVVMKYKGEDAGFTAKFCFFDLGNIEFEVIQPLTGDTIWRDFLDTHGPGIHHIKFSVPEHGPSRAYLESKGFEIEQMGSSVGKNAGKEWVFYNTSDAIGFSIETMNEIVKSTQGS